MHHTHSQPGDGQGPLTTSVEPRRDWLDQFVLLAALLSASLAIAKDLADADLWGACHVGGMSRSA